jgi:hypothetical protein
MRRTSIGVVVSCPALIAVSGATAKAPPVSAATVAKHGLTGYPLNVLDALAEGDATDEVRHSSTGVPVESSTPRRGASSSLGMPLRH